MKKASFLVAILVVLTGCGMQDDSFIGLTKAQEIVTKEQQGEIVKAKSNLDENDPYYEIEVADDTYVCAYRVDATNGKLHLQERRQRHQNNNNATTEEPTTNASGNGAGNGNGAASGNGNGNGNGQHNQNNRPEGTITMKEAQTIALNKVGGGTVVKSDCEYEDDYQTFIYEIDVQFGSVKYEIEINAYTKEIVSYQEDH